MKKSEKTKLFIIKKIAPLFNKKGYLGTSLSDLTTITGLTKGALYGNFLNKQALATAAFEYSTTQLFNKLNSQISTTHSALQQLFLFTSFYRYYHTHIQELGGCPIINSTIFSYGDDDFMSSLTQKALQTHEQILRDIIVLGQQQNEIKYTVNASKITSKILSMIYGATIMSVNKKDASLLHQTVQDIEQLIITELKV